MAAVPEEKASSPVRRQPYNTRTILTAVALGAAVGVLLIPFNFAQDALIAVAPPLGTAIYGLWGISSLVPLAVLRKPGTGVIGGAAAGIVTIISPWGVFMVVMMLMWGVLMELPFLFTWYKFWGWKMFTIAGLITAAVNCWWSYGWLNMSSMATGTAVGVIVVQTLSFVLCSLASLWIAQKLAELGVNGGRRVRASA